MSNSGRLAGKVAVVTGAGSGIGRATAKLFATEGANVVVADIDGDSVSNVANEITAEGGNAVPFQVDVADERRVVDLMTHAINMFGRLDVLHNNAALVSKEHLAGDHMVADTDTSHWNRTMAVNLNGVLFGCRSAIPLMLKSGGGSIINSSSCAGTFGSTSGTSYGASKAAVEHLTLSIAVQYGKQGIRCNGLSIFGIVTETFRKSLDREGIERRERMTLTPYLGTPEDVARATLFLASDDARYITGHILAVDGGMATGSPGSVAASRG